MSTMRRPSKSDTCALALEITSASAHAINGAGCFRPRRITMLALFCRAEVHMIFSLYREVLLRRNRTVGCGDRHSQRFGYGEARLHGIAKRSCGPQRGKKAPAL